MRSLAPVPIDSAPAELSEAAPPPAPEVSVEPLAEVEEPAPRGRWIAPVATAASALWLGIVAATIYLLLRYQPAPDLTLTGLASLAAGAMAPICAIWLVALALRRSTDDERRSLVARMAAAEARLGEVAARTRRELNVIDGVLSAVADRVESIRGSIGSQAAQLMDTAGRLEARTADVAGSLGRDRELLETLLDRLTAGSASARAELTQVLEALPAAETRAGAVAAALASGAADAKRGLVDIEGLLAASQQRGDAARETLTAAVGELKDAIAAIDAESGSAAEGLKQRTAALRDSANTALSRTAEALDGTRRGIEVQVAAVRASTEQARAVLEGFGGEAMRRIGERFAETNAQAERLTAMMEAQEARNRVLVESIERGFGVLDAKLANAAQTSGATLDRLNERLASVREQMHDLATPLGGTESAARELENAVANLRQTTLETIDTLATALPEQVGQTGQAVDSVRSAVASLADDLATLRNGTEALTPPVERGRSIVAEAIEALDAQRAALDSTVGDIANRLADAKAMAAAVDANAQTAALTASTRLVDAMVRVREVAAQAQGTMRTAIEGLVNEAREALNEAGESAVRESFMKRIRTELAEVEAAGEKAAQAAQATAERLSRQMLSVADTAAAVEARIAQADGRLEAASQEDLARRSNLLIEALNSSSIDIAKALSVEVPDNAWAAYLRGDRGVFTRRAVRLLGGGEARAVARRYAEDGEFREGVNRYVHDFEALMRRTMAEREGSPLSVALLSSDIGKLYVALAQALERIRS